MSHPSTPKLGRRDTAASLLAMFLGGRSESSPSSSAQSESSSWRRGKIPIDSQGAYHGPKASTTTQSARQSTTDTAGKLDDELGDSNERHADGEISTPDLPRGRLLRAKSSPNYAALVHNQNRRKPILREERRSSRISKKNTPNGKHVNERKENKTKQQSKEKPGTLTSRQALRSQIALDTGARRANFLKAKKDLFLPLLPKSNYIDRLIDNESNEGSSESGREIYPFEALESQPAGITATLKPYQLSGLSFLIFLFKNGLSGILGDEMGLGKTLQTLSLFHEIKNTISARTDLEEHRPNLVVCPLTVLNSWMNESSRWTPGLKVLRMHGSVQERGRAKQLAEGKGRPKTRKLGKGDFELDLGPDSEMYAAASGAYDVIVTTYDTFKAEHTWFKRAFVWRYVVLDEGHIIKNDETHVAKALQGLRSEYRLMLSGTPIQNNLGELWALLHWLYPEVFTNVTKDLFTNSFDLSRGKASTTVMDNARQLLEMIMLRRMKNSPGVDLALPPKTEIFIYIPLTPIQRFWYMRLLTRMDRGTLQDIFQNITGKEQEARKTEKLEDSVFEQVETRRSESAAPDADTMQKQEILRQRQEADKEAENKSNGWQKLMNLLMQLRKCCNHPYLLPNAEPEDGLSADLFVQASGKLIMLQKLIAELVAKQRKKIIIFSGFTGMLDCCEDMIADRFYDANFKALRVDGSTSRARRNLNIRLFNQADSRNDIILISTKAGGLGLNLAAATEVVLIDQDWNPQVSLQAEARAHRIGQDRPVTVYKFCTAGTVEEQMMGRIQKKLYLSLKIIESMRDIHTSPANTKGKDRSTEDSMPELGMGELKTLMRRGAQTLTHPECDIDELISWDWPTALEKLRDQHSDVIKDEESDKKDAKTEGEGGGREEQRWLSEMEKVETRIFDGKTFSRKSTQSNAEVREELSREERRKGKNTTVMVNGYAVSKESMACKDWEAMPTYAGKDARLAEPPRAKRATITSHQDTCQVCWDGGELITCSGCPRAYHYECLPKRSQKALRQRRTAQFYCPQHECAVCEQKAANVGGMVYRCRWCAKAFCEDCMDWGGTKLLGEQLDEFELIGHGRVNQAFYVFCSECKERSDTDPTIRRAFEEHAHHTAERLAAVVQGSVDEDDSDAPDLTNVTTPDETEIPTPAGLETRTELPTASKKRKRTSSPFYGRDAKRQTVHVIDDD